MHSLKSFLALAFLSLFLLQGQSGTAAAQTGREGKPARQTDSVTQPGDDSKGEVEVTKVTFKGKLEMLRTTYKDGSIRTQIFRADGTLSEEIEAKKYGPTTSTYYKANGKDKEYQLVVTVKTLPQGGFISNTAKTTFRKDGQTPWYTIVSVLSQDLINLYYGTDGKLKLSRTYGSSGSMDVVVFDDKKNELYRQRWERVKRDVKGGGALIGYVLRSTTETTADGTKRRLIMKVLTPIGEKAEIEKAEYLKADGTTVEKTVPAASLSDTPAAERLDEVDRKDDPTVPKTIELP